ncbi:MAG: ornithine cyclodeaminase family protein [Woeseiaceae bacterium]|nr:ornithine cyclodeaminase family protein [Woeseiaceae bacterium]
MQIFSLDQIKVALPSVDLMAEIEHGFVAYSQGRSVVPPVGELVLEDPPGEVHIKYGYLKGDDYYVIKIASGFYGNVSLGLPTSNGMMLMFSQKTGQPVAAMLDEGYLTDVRTAVAGAIAAKYLAPAKVKRIGIVGTGMQAKLQLEHLMPVTDCRDVVVWGRGAEKCAKYREHATALGFDVTATTDADEVLRTCNLIVTTTPAESPLLKNADLLQPGTHITVMGSDTHTKQELAASLLAKADLVVADSISQCLERGEIHQALKVDAIKESNLIELGTIIANPVGIGRSNDEQITIADLTGVAVQDIQITKAVYEATN